MERNEIELIYLSKGKGWKIKKMEWNEMELSNLDWMF